EVEPLPEWPPGTPHASACLADVAAEDDESRADPCCRGSRSGEGDADAEADEQDRKSTRLNSSHLVISYAVFCLKKKKKKNDKTYFIKIMNTKYTQQTSQYIDISSH